MDMFDGAVQKTKRVAYEELNGNFQKTYEEFKALEKVIDDKFGDAAPSLADCRTALSEMKQAISDILDKKRREEPDPPSLTDPQTSAGGSVEQTPGSSGADNSVIFRVPLLLSNMQGSQSQLGASWQDAETLLRSGQIEKGLAEMTRLAASETNGRNRFQRKLLLAEACLASKRERLARSILEELAEQIDKFQLELWESSELISSVWTKLYRLYKLGAESSDLERANKLYDRLCRLDPWQALGCTEG
jgi:tetratricopeptide (TPR) repeat protein